MEIDCSKTDNFLREWKRMCESSNVRCSQCAIMKSGNKSCREIIVNDTVNAEKIIQEWSDDHQRKTYLEDFKDKFPKTTESDDDITRADSKYCVSLLYGEAPKMMTENGHTYSCNGRCEKCWNQPMSEAQG